MKYTRIQCLFEQSGTFKSQFRRLGELAFDYDIENQFGETDYICDLFEIINSDRLSNIIYQDSLTIAFFPCTYFTNQNLSVHEKSKNVKNLSIEQYKAKVKEFNIKREEYYKILCKLIEFFKINNLPLIIENPTKNIIKKRLLNDYGLELGFIDNDRTVRGDCFQKPTMFYFINFKQKELEFFIREMPGDLKNKKILQQPPGITKSLITKEYAYNFIREFII